VVGNIQLLILDVDGVLTDGRLVMADGGETIKTFHVLDGGGIRLWRQAGRRVALLTSRTSSAVARRAGELGIEYVHQGSGDKLDDYVEICRQTGLDDGNVCYMGDDYLDAGPMRRCGYPVAVANAAPEIKRIARYITGRAGGAGAVREVVRHLLIRDGRWGRVLAGYGLNPA
jgi:3-deoxy-D-manno-octulosonate 8-phosphate phosphatase (KDO 8-P phosphatase)